MRFCRALKRFASCPLAGSGEAVLRESTRRALPGGDSNARWAPCSLIVLRALEAMPVDGADPLMLVWDTQRPGNSFEVHETATDGITGKDMGSHWY